jgi:hypothetical protein
MAPTGGQATPKRVGGFGPASLIINPEESWVWRVEELKLKGVL